MPITLQTATLKYKNSNGEFQSADCLKGDPGSPADVIDDTAGSGVTGKAWSADKTLTEINGLSDEVSEKLNSPETEGESGQILSLDANLEPVWTDQIDCDPDSIAPVIVKSASGSIVSFNDGADEMPLKDCVVQINPVQDLHGYENPWPAGDGKNKFDPDNVTSGYIASDGSIQGQSTTLKEYYSDYIPVNASTAYTIGYNAYAVGEEQWQSIAWYDSNKVFISRSAGTSYNSRSYTSPANASFARAGARTFDHGLNNLYFSQGDNVSYSPYSNICPITGWTEVNVIDDPSYGGFINWNQHIDLDFTNANKYPKANVTPTVTDRKVTLVTTSNSTTLKGLYLKKNLEENHVYVFCGKIKNGTAANANMGIYSSANGAVKVVTNTETNVVDVCDICINASGTNWFGIRIQNSSERGTYGEFEDIQLFDLTEMFGAGNEPATVEEFKSLFPNEYYDFNAGEKTCVSAVSGLPHENVSVSWQTEAGTVYGGSLNLTTGVLTVDKALMSITSASQYGTYNTETGKGTFWYKSGAIPLETINDGVICNRLVPNVNVSVGSSDGLISWFANNGLIRWTEKRDMSVSDYNNWLAQNPLEVTYRLTEPQVYQLSPVEISTLLGQNNIWADCGNVSVDYCADTKTYVDGSIPSVPVQDVQVNGTSILQNGVANVPVGGTNNFGVVKSDNSHGIELYQGSIWTIPAATAHIKGGGESYRVISPQHQHESVFYGLAKAAGADMKNSSNAVGVYTPEAMIAIQKMLGIPLWESIELSASDYDTDLGMFVFDAGEGKEISEARIVGQVVYDTALTDQTIELGIGFGNTANRKYYNEFAMKTVNVTASQSISRIMLEGEGKNFVLGSSNNRTQFGYGNYGQNANASHVINVDIRGSISLDTNCACFYHTYNDPRYLHIKVPTGVSWAYFYIEYLLR